VRGSSGSRHLYSLVAFGAAVPILLGGTWSGSSSQSASSAQPRTVLHREIADTLGDGFPDSARLDAEQDRRNFVRWFTLLAEAPFYAPTPQTRVEVHDCAALIRYAFRNALASHTAAWRRDAGLPFEPGFGDVAKFTYPHWPLGKSLFRIQPGPLRAEDFSRSAFSEFADAGTLLHYNTFFVSRDVRAARPGDLFFFHQPTQQEPFHTMLFLGGSHFRTERTDWIVYHTGDINGREGEIREVSRAQLLAHPDPHWRPLAGNTNFLGVYRLEILR
jgi:uncharacterized protein